MDFTAISSAWAVPAPTQVASLTRGANNAVYRIDAGSVQYVLRIYRNHADAARLDVEYQILMALRNARLPFAIPAPIATVDGQFYTYFSDAEHGPQIAALFPWAPGDHPRREDEAAAFAAAVALGQLDMALSALSFSRNRLLAPLGDFMRRYPTLGDPTETLATLTSDSAAIDRIVDMYLRLNDELPALYATLPC